MKLIETRSWGGKNPQFLRKQQKAFIIFQNAKNRLQSRVKSNQLIIVLKKKTEKLNPRKEISPRNSGKSSKEIAIRPLDLEDD